VLETTRAADYAIWGVALLFYLYDAARVLGARDMLLVEGPGGRLAPTLGDNPFASAVRTLAFGPLHLPHRGAFVAVWGRPWSDDTALEAALESIARLRAELRVLRALAACAGILLFVVGPALTLALGPDAAVVYTAAGLYPTVVAAVVALWWRRGAYGLTASRSVVLSIVLLVCPAFLPNVVRKVTGQPPLALDGAQLVVATATAEVKDAFLARLERRTEAMLEEATADPTEGRELRAYLSTLQGAR
jgi:hypothetical protein